jgi:hypothetical protein
MLRKPILGLVSDRGASADLLKKLGGMIVSPDDVPSLIKAMDELLNQWHAGNLKRVDNFDQVAAAYSSQRVALSLEQILFNAIEQGARSFGGGSHWIHKVLRKQEQ